MAVFLCYFIYTMTKARGYCGVLDLYLSLGSWDQRKSAPVQTSSSSPSDSGFPSVDPAHFCGCHACTATWAWVGSITVPCTTAGEGVVAEA